MGNDTDYAASLWDRAEECRAKAERTDDRDLRAQYRKLANAYLKLAAKEERLLSLTRKRLTRN
jgi:hypothetical protein